MNQWRSLEKKVNTKFVKIAKSAYVTTAGAIDLRSPVAEEFGGLFRSNWFMSLNQPSTKLITAKDKATFTAFDTTPQAALDDSIAAIDAFNLGDTLYYTNNSPYGGKLEYGGYNDGPKTIGGYSTQAPEGMVRISVAEFPQIVDKLIRKIK